MSRRRPIRAAIGAVLVVLLLALAVVPAAALSATPVWINEIHYDNAGADVGEGVEIAGVAGTSLDGWSLELHNGYDGRRYGTTTLSGVLAEQQDGFGTQWFPIPGLQNGSPDGVALIDPFGRVAEFLSYEGAMAAIGGAADGLASSAMLPFERPSTSAGLSLQLVGDGHGGVSLRWAAPMPQSPGSVNAGEDLAVAARNHASTQELPPPAASTEAPTPTPTAPRLLVLRLRQTIGVARARLLHLGRIRYVLTAPAVVRFTVARAGATVAAGVLTHRGSAGRNTVEFGGWIGGRRLAPGRYRLTARAGEGAPLTVGFRVRR